MRRHKIYTLLLIFIIAVSCHKKDSVVNGSVTPNNFLSDQKYDKLIVEILYVNGFQPTTATVDNLKAFLSQRLNKSGGITIIQTPVSSPGNSSYSLDAIKNTENAFRTQNTNGTTLTACFFFADADYASNSGSSKVLGIAYGNSSMCIFEKTIREFSGGLTQPSATTLETTVILHEFGHILGLVNNGTPMQAQHQDAANGKHCDDKNCLMYWSVETSDVVANILGSNIPALNSKCLDDLRANGGK